MGTWSTGLYADDSAADLRDTIAVLSKLPVDGERLLDLLLEGYEGGTTPADDGGPAFWLVIADQFERRGIESETAFERALEMITGGYDLRDWERRGASPSDLKKRQQVLATLESRLRSPRVPRPRPKRTRPPVLAVSVGQVYSFPTMGGRCHNAWFSSWEKDRFVPDGWGALIVLGAGRLYDWIPWCATSALSVSPTEEPTLAAAARARLYSKQGATYCVPRLSHMKRMGMQLLGQLELNPSKAASVISGEHPLEVAVHADWSFMSQARAWNTSFPGGIAVAELMAV